jgi:hypothetical protein
VGFCSRVEPTIVPISIRVVTIMCILDLTYLSAELITMRISSRSVGSGLLIREREATRLPL